MEDIMADIRRAVTDEQAGKMALRTAETRQAKPSQAKPSQASQAKPSLINASRRLPKMRGRDGTPLREPTKSENRTVT